MRRRQDRRRPNWNSTSRVSISRARISGEWRLAFFAGEPARAKKRNRDDDARVYQFPATLSARDADHCRRGAHARGAEGIDAQTKDRRPRRAARLPDAAEVARSLLCDAHLFASE